MERTQHELTGQRRLERDLSRHSIADFAHQDHFRILPHDRSQAGRQIEPCRQVDLRLGHAGQGNLDRIFQRDDASAPLAASRNLAQASIERGCLATAGRADDKNRARSLAQQSTQAELDVVPQVQIGQLQDSASST